MPSRNATVYNEEFNPVRADIDVQGDKIACVGACVDSGDSLDLSGYTIIPGLIDMHIHGCAGEDTSDTDVKGLDAMSQCLVKKGITSFCPTSMTLSFEELQKIFANGGDAMKYQVDRRLYPRHQYGRPLYRHVQKGRAESPPTSATRTRRSSAGCTDGCGGMIKVVDIAPGMRRRGGVYQCRSSPYCPVSIAHTAAGYDRGGARPSSGACATPPICTTPMSGLTHREPRRSGRRRSTRGASVRPAGGADLRRFPHPSRRACVWRSASWARTAPSSSATPCVLPATRTANTICGGQTVYVARRQGPAGRRHHRRLYFQRVRGAEKRHQLSVFP